MPKIQRGIRVRQIPGKPHLRALYFGIHKELQDHIRQVPGVNWKPKERYWQAPVEMMEQVAELGRRFGRPVVGFEPARFRADPSASFHVDEQLYPYHHEGIMMALAQRHFLLNYEMGIGKTPGAIEVMKLGGVTSAVVVCPALVRYHWEAEIDKWWPNHPPVYVVESTAKLKKDQPEGGIIVVSYELLPTLWNMGYTQTGAVVIDECHYIANKKTRRSKAVRSLLNANRESYLLFLTATPITNRPTGLWHQLDSLWPGRFGTYWDFINRYAEFVENPYADTGFTPAGLNERHGEELRCRLEYCTKRLTRKDELVSKHLPALNVVPIPIKPKRSFKIRDLLTTIDGMRQHANRPDALVRACGCEKVGAAVEQVKQVIDAGGRPAVLTHLRATAEEIAAMLRTMKIGEVCHVDGDVPIKARMRKIDDAKRTPGSILVSTMHAINVGINLIEWTEPIFAEIYPTPGVMVQALGRFPRIGSTDSVTVYVLVLQGTHEEQQCANLREKVKDVQSVIRTGESEQELDKALATIAGEDADPYESLWKAAQSKLEEDEYGG